MTRSWRAALIAGLLLIGAHQRAMADAPEPYQLVRALEVLQDEVAKGSQSARAGQRSMLEQIGNQFLKVAPEVWSSSRNVRAAVLFTLSGGSPSVVRRVIDLKALSEADRNMMIGALAYVSGREAEARFRLKTIDPRTLGPVLGGNIALVIGSLMMRDEPATAIKMFGLSRLLLPGSLIEEAALRREAFMRFDANDIDSFSKLGAQYLRRFNKSAYSDQFRQRLDLSIRHLARTADPSVIGKLEPFFEDASNAYTEGLLLLFAREGLINGRLASGRAATERAKSFAHSDPKLADRMKVYSSFVQVMSSDTGAARDQLASLRTKVESAEDRWLIEAGTSLADRITRWPPDVPAPDMVQTEDLKADDVASIAQVSLKKSAQLLVRADK